MLRDLGRRLAELRAERGWTQAFVAERLGMPMRDYQAIEGGKRAITIRTAVMIAQVLETPVRSLFDRPMSREPPKPGRPRVAHRTPSRPRNDGVTPKRRPE